MSDEKYRLVTRADFDGLVCAVLLQEMGLIDEVIFAHPKDMQDGKIAITSRDITTNLPYVPGAHLVFDHHEAETVASSGRRGENHIIDASAPSSARLIYNHYGGKATFARVTDEMMAAVDQADVAQYSREDIVDPQRWVLLNYLMDSRTGLGRFREFRISNYTLMMNLIQYCRDHSIEEILQLPDVQERVALYREHAPKAREQLQRCAIRIGRLVVLDLRDEEVIWATNRYTIYALFPDCNLSIHVVWGLQKQNTVFFVGKSILDRSSQAHVGNLMLELGGRGNANVGTCQLPNDKADVLLQTLVQRITAEG